MPLINSFAKYSIIAIVFSWGLASAATLQLSAGVQSSEFLGGVNLADDTPGVTFNVDWAFDQGGFTGADCYASNVSSDLGLARGCGLYVGYFNAFDDNNALSLQLTRHEYSRAFNRSWDFTEFSTSWHLSKKSSLSASYAEKWLGTPYDSVNLRADTQISLTESLGLNLSANVTELESGAPVDNLISAEITLIYLSGRWTTELGLVYTDRDQQQMFPFDIDEPDALLSVSYRLY